VTLGCKPIDPEQKNDGRGVLPLTRDLRRSWSRTQNETNGQKRKAKGDPCVLEKTMPGLGKQKVLRENGPRRPGITQRNEKKKSSRRKGSLHLAGRKRYRKQKEQQDKQEPKEANGGKKGIKVEQGHQTSKVSKRSPF